jgi:protoporphyrin/coproporphyrin ferrochelatase
VTAFGVLVMAHGTPATLDDLEAFYTEIRRGRPPSPEQLDELRKRYEAIGGTSPLTERTRAQVAGITASLKRRPSGNAAQPVAVALGMKFADPRIETAMDELVAAGADDIVGVVLAPHSSVVSVGEYARRARSALDRTVSDQSPSNRPSLTMVDHWFDAPGFAALVGSRLRDALGALDTDGTGDRNGARVVFTAHSVPSRVVDEGDDYPEQVASSAQASAAAGGLERWTVAWQSAGRTPEPWLGPDLRDVIRDAATGGASGVVVCPIGFVSDHLEILYDIDIEARAVADEVGIRMVRTASFNGDPEFCELVAQVINEAFLGAKNGT